MSPPVRSEDPENPKSAHPRCRSLDYFFIISLVLLSLAVGSLCTLYVAWERPQLESSIKEQIYKDQQGRTAQLVVDNGHLINGTLEWAENGVANHFIGNYFKQYNKELVINKNGFYLISSQITLRCVEVGQCHEKGSVSLSILKNIGNPPILTVNVHIEGVTVNSNPSSNSGSIRYLSSSDRIWAQLQTSHKIDDWQIDQDHSVVGLTWMSDTSSIDYHRQ